MNKQLKLRLESLRERRGGLLKIEDIEKNDIALLVSEIFKGSRHSSDRYQVWLEVFTEYGIICPHPQHKLLYEGKFKSLVPTSEYRWFNCEMCGCSVFNEYWLRKVIEAEKADKRGCYPTDRRENEG